VIIPELFEMLPKFALSPVNLLIKGRRSMYDELRGSVLVVGGGIAGMQSALDLADSGYYVYLLEKSPSIGGVMAQLDKTFPTNDCAM
jgi:heterodisulfide reductase subunit A-like polyferredoxin